MKKIILAIAFLGLLISPTLSQAQSTDQSTPKFVRYGRIPHFSITAAGKKTFTNEDLKKGVPTILILFSVDCSHCQHETREIIKHINKFKGAQIIMVTPFDYDQMYAFYRGYGVQKHQDIITMGSDPSRKLNMFYHLRYWPGIYIYDKKGEIVYHKEGFTPINKLTQFL